MSVPTTGAVPCHRGRGSCSRPLPSPSACSLAAPRRRPAPPVATYAIVVGSNAGGPGQADLRYAEDDARRVGDVLDRARRLRARSGRRRRCIRRPISCAIGSTKLAARVAADVAAGRQARVFFYYSGHARASAIDLGNDELPLEELRAAAVRGARDADRRRARCLPERRVLARQGRGAGRRLLVQLAPAPRRDRRRGARVVERQRAVAGERAAARRRTSRTTCSSACAAPATRTATARSRSTRPIATRITRRCSRRPRPRSAASTSRSRPISRATARCRCRFRARRPRRSSCRPRLEGKTLVEDKRAHAVVAETYKAQGRAVRIAVAPGDYEVLVRHGDTLSRCEVTAPGTIDLDRCRERGARDDARPRAAASRAPTIGSRSAASLGVERDDAYTEPAQDVRLQRGPVPVTSRPRSSRRCARSRRGCGSAASRRAVEHAAVDARHHRQHDQLTARLEPDDARPRRPRRAAARHRAAVIVARFDVYGQLGGRPRDRPHRARRRDEQDDHDDLRRACARRRRRAPLRRRSRPRLRRRSPATSYDYAPVITDLIGDTHASGGHRVDAALSFAF